VIFAPWQYIPALLLALAHRRWVDCGIRAGTRGQEGARLKLSDEVRAFLDETRFAVLATINASGSPQQSVMWYELRGDTIVMNTLRGRRKDRNLLRDPRASVCVEEGQRYVTLLGTIEFVDDPAVGQADIAALARRYDGPEAAAKAVASSFSKQERVTLLLHVTSVDAHGFAEEE
jgi:PPOX class probable F420-dependent enzyme